MAMKDRLRSLMRTLAVAAFLICALSLAAPGPSHARPSNASQSVHINGLPCNAVCMAYMSWSHRVTAIFHPSRSLKIFPPARPPKTNVAHHGRPPRMVVHHAPKTHQRSLNSFAQWPVQSDATPDSTETPRAAETPGAVDTPIDSPRAMEMAPATEPAQVEKAPPAVETPQNEVAAPRPNDQIADRFPATRDFMRALRVGPNGAALDGADSTAVAAADTAARATGTVDASAHGADMRLVGALLLALGILVALRFFGEVKRHARRWPRARSALGA